MYTITDWRRDYEVNSHGGPLRDGQDAQTRPLKYIRLKVHGRSLGAGWRRMQDIAGKHTAEVFGIFCKLLEIAGSEDREHRGQILTGKGQPATIDDLSFDLNIPADQIARALNVLADLRVSWIMNDTDTTIKVPLIKKEKRTEGSGFSGNVRELPEITGTPVKLTVPHRNYMDTWNEMASKCGRPVIIRTSGKRQQQIRLRHAEDGFVEAWPGILEKIPKSDFLMGKVGGWAVTFDWIFLNGSNWLKISEGNYDGKADDAKKKAAELIAKAGKVF